MLKKIIRLDDSELFRLGLALISLGLLIVWLSSESLFPSSTPINEAIIRIGSIVTIEGNVTNEHKIANGWIFEIKDETGSIKAVLFDKKLNISSFQRIQAVGEVTIYEREPELKIFKTKPLPF